MPARTADFLQGAARRCGAVRLRDRRFHRAAGAKPATPSPGQAVPLPEGADDASTNNRMRRGSATPWPR